MNNTFSFQQIAAPKVLSAEVREAISNNVLQFYVRDQQQDTQDEGITALYERLSQEDKLEGESNSIANHDVMFFGVIHPLYITSCMKLFCGTCGKQSSM